ncbi:hypothetical protein LEP1GSC202_1519 [Leptospira yanagawae serovar Saopaulo str. Sao Paulo = ATCC 700523]|uniref:Cysteine rich repeat domain protein n=1 Tax=Leptospira yanagawae serovar Saopaulo str. Sao Paulo = ATCC 700523 TaxID=1249483 RepID=A0A5E8HE05_9LEPT|nr:hypothetical protein [Leptospira yanagawae]EOQ89122.1 hypothetical protein LEP1GSC202_1519 [Leptospira yanagawae serovar Saopaulo str. Sao Paulo = ATCC 700523]
MKKITLIWILFFLPYFVFANADTKSKEMCECLKKAKSSQAESDKKECLNLREKHVKALKKGSKQHEGYLKSLNQCEQELAGLPQVDPNLTTEEKTKLVCDCMKQATKQNRMGCFKLQSDYAKTISDSEEKKAFNLNSQSCGE